jgi:L-fuculose-phosphate aldolase
VRLHIELYNKNKDMNSIVIAHPLNLMAFAVSEVDFDTKTIPESYILLRDIPKLPYGMEFGSKPAGFSKLTDILNKKTPVVLCENDCVIVTGSSLLETFDRLEVAEFSAKAIIASNFIGKMIPIGEKEIIDLEKVFFKD